MKEEYITIYAIMPSEIYSTKDLTAEEKLIAERITALCKKEGYAWISNKALADMYGIREDTVSKHIRHLRQYGYIKCLYDKSDKNKSQRTIYLVNNVWDEYTKPNRMMEQDNVGYISEYNNKRYNHKNNIKYNITENGNPMFGKKDGIEYWHGKPIITQKASPEEIREMEELLAEFSNGDSDE